MNRYRKNSLLAVGALIAITVAVYAGSLGGDFVWDDRGYILDTPELLYPQNIPLVLDPDLYFSRFQEGSWRPLVTLSHFLAVGLFDYWAPGHNALDLALYAVVVLLVFGAALRLGAGRTAAFLAAALFAVHPVHVEPVMVSALRADLLCGAFLLSALLCLLKADEVGRGGLWWAGGVGLFALGLLSKEVALVFPLLVAAYDLARARRGQAVLGPRALVRRYGPLVVITGLYAALRFGPFAGPPHSTGYVGGTLSRALLSSLGIFAQYVRLLLFPLRLNADYLVEPITSLADPRALVGLVALAALVSAVAAGYRRRPLAGFGLAWLLIALLPVSNLVPLDNPMAERYLFIPSIGLCWAVGLLGAEALEKTAGGGRPAWARGLAWGAAFGVVLAFGLRAAVRTRDWRDGIALWRASVAASPRSARAHLNLGSAYLLRGMWDEGREEIKRALAIDPDSHESLHNLGLIKGHKGDWAGAEEAYRRSLALQPDAPPTLYNLANALAAQGKTDEAVALLERAVARKPLFAEAHLLIGNLLMDKGRARQAAEAYGRALAARPEVASQAYTNLGNAERESGRLEEAEAAYRKALELKPHSAEAHFNLASLYGQQGRYRETMRELEEALAADPSLVVAHKNLGLLYLKVARDPARARHHLQRVLDLAPDHPDAPAIRKLVEGLPPS